ncbi:unnamed protein product [Diatraea saccharalis]|uniref:Uncharacterized protein n=1 Tax=Diatraea saccharalis TaxID=40085 RepID=A0A9N9QU65_9NEOP|nr:unnamed protein product [Diatraea saccharalis]
MSNGALPQWKRELLQRRAARSRPTPPPAHAPPPPPPLPAHAPPDEDEELRYGPGIVKRLKSRYLSLALRDAPRRRPSVLRRAASLEHLLDERPPPAPRPPPARAPRPASVAAPPAFLPQPRRDIVKRARSVDALSGLDSREEPRIASPSPPPPRSPSPGPRAPPTAGPPRPPAPSPPPPPRAPPTPPPEPAPRPTPARGARPPRRPTPLLRDTERPPPDAVRAALRKFESAPARRTAPAARVSAVLRGLEGPAHTSTPEPRDRAPAAPRSPTPPLEPTAAVSFDESDGDGAARPVSRAALEGIARAGSSVRFLFPARGGGSHLPPPAAANPVLLGRARRVGVIRPMPMRSPDPPEPPPLEIDPKLASPPATPRPTSPLPAEPELGPAIRLERRDPPPAALVEPIPRRPLEERPPPPQPEPPRENETEPGDPRPKDEKALANGHPEPRPPAGSAPSRLGTADVERAWNGSGDRRSAAEPKERESAAASEERRSPWEGARRARAPPPATSVVFDFSGRKEVPDYIENDGIVLRGGRRARFKVSCVRSFALSLRPFRSDRVVWPVVNDIHFPGSFQSRWRY